ncbi:T7SS effector LXG polymorphic toxin [Bacillus altitudinis]|nr:T7SS effector LXG polymorphic toxin [Bacillus altitudinis]MEE3613057.1 T7SS effector LXG polymorphic toxin [Bacillus altitudinis]MEE3648312.1 T7SS effector LXG polymorphic toxin [Bacillus altitudinis]MEE4393040.1 T7SS effector LXG polymorphic toxin [Bacillus altitudinis]MEE4396765.1 T7SS effector LXG polymorphic toxin [Bacillus altitudinis]
MGKILDAKALTSAMDTRAKHYQELREQMIDLKKALQGVANLGDDFTGKGADNIKSFYKELAGNVDMFISFIDKQKAFHEGVSGTLDDTNFGGDTFVEEHFLDNAVHMGIKNAKSIVKDQKKALKTIFQDIDDLISLEVFDSKTFDEKIADAEDERKKTVKDLIELDQNLKDEYALSETEEKATMALYAEMMNATNDGKSILPMNFDKKAYQNSEIYKAKSDIEKQTSEYLKIKKDQEEARKIAKEQEALANRPWYEKALDYGGNIVNELTGVNDAKRAATGVDPITGEELTAGQRVAAGGMAAAGYIPIVGWAGRIFKGGKAVYKTTQATSAAVRAVDIYKTSQKSFDALKTSQKGLYGLTATNGFSEAITGRDMFGNKISKEQQEASMNAALAMLLPFGSKGFQGKMGVKGAGKSTDIPSVRNKEFNKWFDKLSVDEFEKAWNVPALRSKIEDRIRQPGGYHEWHLVARTPQFKKWDVSMDRIKELRTLTKDVEFVNPPGRHGGRGSTKAHNEILKIIDNAPDYESFVRELNEWASKRMKNGVQDLPEGLRR